MTDAEKLELSAATRRAVMECAARESMGYFSALEFLVMEGIKAQANCPPSCAANSCGKPEDKTGIKNDAGKW
jgi:hypothetical protein